MKNTIPLDQTHVYVITHIGSDGLRHLSAANQGRYHHATFDEAAKHLENMLKNSSKDTLISIHGPQAWGTYEVRKVECYPGGDTKRTIFDK